MSYLFKDYGNAQAALYFFNFVVGGIVPMIILVLRWISNEDDPVPSGDVGRALSWILRLIPAFSFGEGMINLGSLTLLSRSENSDELNAFDLEITLAPIIYLVVGFFVYFGIVFFIEFFQSNEKLMRCCSS